jgi:hypothetical protein
MSDSATRPPVMYLVGTGSSMKGKAGDEIGIIVGPRQRGLLPIREGRWFALDNDAFNGTFDEGLWRRQLGRLELFADRCLFAVVPDVWGDAAATFDLFERWAPVVREFGFPTAYVAQDGSENYPLPRADVLFIGGSDTWRSAHAAAMAGRAKRAGMRVHVGRVNSLRRFHACSAFGADSCDGTHLSRRREPGQGIEPGLNEIKVWIGTATRGLFNPGQEAI